MPKPKQTICNTELAATLRDIVCEEISEAFDTKLQPVNELITSLTSKVDKCEESLGSLEYFANDSAKRLARLENDQEAGLCSLFVDKERTKTCTPIKKQHLLGLENKAGNLTNFINVFLCELFGKEKMGPISPAVIAHRTSPPHKTSRGMIVRLYSTELKTTIIRSAAGRAPLMYRGKIISIYPDLSADTRKQRDEFKELRIQ